MKEKIEASLHREFEPSFLKVTDDSHQHAGHAGNPSGESEGTHFSVEIVSAKFEGKSAVERHRMIYAVTAPFKSIHALAIKAKAVALLLIVLAVSGCTSQAAILKGLLDSGS